jgi:uncharacterized repeat protein (TIGR02543 family)
MRAKRKRFGGWVSRLLIATILATPINFLSFMSAAMAEDPPGSINLANASNGNSSLSTTLAESPGSGDLTYEFWYKQVDDSSNQVIFSTQSTPNSNDGFEFRKNYANIEVWSGGNYLGGSGIDYMNLNQWNHFVIMRVGPSNWIIYRNGDCRAYFQLSTTTSTKLTLGSTDESSFRGKIANFRYAKSALYTDPKFSNFLKNEPRFTPPLTPHLATPETKVLLNTVQGANFAVDTSASPNTFTLSAAFPPTSSTETPLPIYAKFEANGGSGSMSNQVSSVTANLSSNSYTKSGSTFYGWNTQADGTGTFYKNGASYGFTSSITLHAQWSPNSVAVNFNSDGGSAVSASSVVIGSAITSAPTPPTKSGYTFGGWKPTAGGSAVTFPYYPILTRTYAASVTSAALVDLGRYESKGLWLSNIWYGPNRGTSPSSTRDYVTYTDGAKYVAIRESNNSVIGSPLRMDGYYLVPLDTSTTLTAIWAANPHTITYDLDGGSGSTPTQADVATAGTFTTANTPVRTHWSFAGWSDGTTTTAANTSFTVGTENVTLTALWTRNSSSVTFDSQNWQTATVVSTNQGIAATAPTNPTWYGYNFKGWSETSTGSLVDVSTVTITGTKTFYAIWEQKSLAGLTNLSNPDILNPHATFDRTITSSYGNTTTSIKVPGGALPSTFQVKVYTIDDVSFASQALGAGTYLISQVVAWADTATGSVGNIQDTATGKPIEMTITSPSITVGSKVYALLGNSSRVLGTATENGRVTVTFSEDPVIIVEAGPPAVVTPTTTGSSPDIEDPVIIVEAGPAVVETPTTTGSSPGSVVASGSPKVANRDSRGTDGSKLLLPTGEIFGLLVVGLGLVLIFRRRAKTRS